MNSVCLIRCAIVLGLLIADACADTINKKQQKHTEEMSPLILPNASRSPSRHKSSITPSQARKLSGEAREYALEHMEVTNHWKEYFAMTIRPGDVKSLVKNPALTESLKNVPQLQSRSNDRDRSILLLPREASGNASPPRPVAPINSIAQSGISMKQIKKALELSSSNNNSSANTDPSVTIDDLKGCVGALRATSLETLDINTNFSDFASMTVRPSDGKALSQNSTLFDLTLGIQRAFTEPNQPSLNLDEGDSEKKPDLLIFDN